MSLVGYKNYKGQEKTVKVEMNNHTEAFMQVKGLLTDPEVGVISDVKEVGAVGHRIVQGGAPTSLTSEITPTSGSVRSPLTCINASVWLFISTLTVFS